MNNNCSDYMFGGCFDLALRLREKTGLTIWGLADDLNLFHHAFIVDKEGNFYDARGKVDAEDIAYYRGRKCKGENIVKANDEDIKEFEDNRTRSFQMIDAFIRKTPILTQLVSENIILRQRIKKPKLSDFNNVK